MQYSKICIKICAWKLAIMTFAHYPLTVNLAVFILFYSKLKQTDSETGLGLGIDWQINYEPILLMVHFLLTR